MSVNYDLYETPDLAKSGEEQPLHARVVLKGSYTAEEFAKIGLFADMPVDATPIYIYYSTEKIF